MPVFDARSEGYVHRGAYCVPLYEGAPSRDALEALAAAPSPVEALAALPRRRLATPLKVGEGLPPAALLVRLHDGQLSGIVGVAPSGYAPAFKVDGLDLSGCEAAATSGVERGTLLKATRVSSAVAMLLKAGGVKGEPSLGEVEAALNNAFSVTTGVARV